MLFDNSPQLRVWIAPLTLALVAACGVSNADAEPPSWQGFLPGKDLKDCRVNLPLYLYFSQPMDASRGRPIKIIDAETGKPLENWEGTYPGDKSCFEVKLRRHLEHGRTYRIEFAKGDKRFRSDAGEAFDATSVGSLSFSTHAHGAPPRPLYLRLRNDNTHVSVAGMQRMLAHGMDLIEINCVKIKDGWVSNHLERPHNAGTKVHVIIPGTSVPGGKGGDYPAFKRITTEPHETSYATYAEVDYIDKTDGVVDPLPRFEDVLRVIQRWDRPIHLQIEAPTATSKDFEALFRQTKLDVSRIHSWHSGGTTRQHVPLSKDRESRAALFYPPSGKGLGEGFAPGEAEFPNGMTPSLIQQAHAAGKTSWLYSYVTKPNVVIAARLGVQYMCDNDLAYEGNRLSRQTMFELNSFDGNRPPRVMSLFVDDGPIDGRADVSGSPEISLRFTDTMELRSVNYETVTLHRHAAGNQARIPLRIRGEDDFRTFKVKPQQPLQAGTRYTLTIASSSEHGPFDLGGLPLAEQRQATFTVGD